MANKAVNKRKKSTGSEDLTGMHIYKGDHNHYVYYNVLNHAGCILNDVPEYRTCSSHFTVGLIGGILTCSFDLGALLSIIIGVEAYALMEVKFRLLLKKQAQIPNFKPREHPLRLLTTTSEETKKIYVKITAYLLFGILIILLPFSEDDYGDLMKAMCIALDILAVGVSLFQVRALFYKKANLSLTDKKQVANGYPSYGYLFLSFSVFLYQGMYGFSYEPTLPLMSTCVCLQNAPWDFRYLHR